MTRIPPTKPIRWLAAIVFVALGALPGKAEVVRTDRLHILLSTTSSTDPKGNLARDWPAACEQLARALRPGSGPWGLGVFTSHTCQNAEGSEQPEHKVDADDSQMADADESSDWQLRVHIDADTTSLTLIWKNAEKPVAETKFKGKHPVQMLKDPDFAQIIAANLLDQSPFLARLDGDPSLIAQKHIVTSPPATKAKNLLPPPPKRLRIFTLIYDEKAGIWRPKAVGAAKLIQKSEKSFKWKVLGRIPKNLPLYVLSSKGRNSNKAILEKSLNKTQNAIVLAQQGEEEDSSVLDSPTDLLRKGISSVYLGVRYGHSIFQGPVIENMSFVGVLVELRGAPLNGLRFYYDQWPEVKEKVESGADSFSGHRAVLGWSLGLNPGWLVDRIDVTPKIGMWTMRSRILVPFEDLTTQAVNFNVDNALGLGAEIGAEIHTHWILARAWAAGDFGVSLVEDATGKDTSVSTTRFGIDTFVEGPAFRLFGRTCSLSFLLFGLYEDVTFNQKAKESSEAVTIPTLEYGVGYLGGGLAISY